MRDTFSCANFSDPYMDVVTSAKFPKIGRVYARACVPQFDHDFAEQLDAERQVIEKRASARRMMILLRPDRRRDAVNCLLNQHDPQRRKELFSVADSFVKGLDLSQMRDASKRPNRAVRHDPSNPRLAVETILGLVKSECDRLNISCDPSVFQS